MENVIKKKSFKEDIDELKAEFKTRKKCAVGKNEFLAGVIIGGISFIASIVLGGVFAENLYVTLLIRLGGALFIMPVLSLVWKNKPESEKIKYIPDAGGADGNYAPITKKEYLESGGMMAIGGYITVLLVVCSVIVLGTLASVFS